jgi:excisionase family DNA binding protein
MLTVEEAAKALAVHPQTVRRMIQRGELYAVKVARHYRVPQSALVQLANPTNASEVMRSNAT